MKAYLLVGGALALVAGAATASAHETEKERKEVRTVVIHKDGEGGHAEAHAIVHGAKCKDAVVKSDVDVETEGEDGKKQRTRLLICNSEKDAAKARAQALEALEKARENLAERDEDALSAEHRARALAALDAEIARLKSQ